MNYFEVFGIPVQLKVAKKDLPQKFFELSRKYHPDYFVRETEDAQVEALEFSALLNKAFKTFQDEDETIKYVLSLKGLLQEEEKYELPPAFLMEVMEINEQLMDLEDPHEKAGIGLALTNMQKEIYEPVKDIIENYQEGVCSEEELLQVKEYYYKKKYLDRLRREMGK